MEHGKFNPDLSLEAIGFKNLGEVHYNYNEPKLIQESLLNGEGTLGKGGTLLVNTGTHTGRSPNDKFIVEDENTINEIWWEKNGAMTESNFGLLLNDVKKHVEGKDIYVQDLYAAAEEEFKLNVRVITELAWHSLFIRHLLRRYTDKEIYKFTSNFTVINCPSFKADPSKYGCRSSTVIAINFKAKLVIICGTEYAGENKKSVFTVLNYLLPKKGVMPMHCSANHAIGNSLDSAVFFGLSGTGKTTLSADPNRTLIGDDEHGWGPSGIFNFEGGCYAKTINLNSEKEPEIFATTETFGTVIENMVFDKHTLELNFSDDSITQNMRCAYPLDCIGNASTTSIGGPPKHIIMLTCDAFGVLPPVAKLSKAQAIFHFLSGFTSKIAGTEQGINEPQPTFSTCYGAPFMPLKPEVYGRILGEKIEKTGANCWLINTGWIGGAYGAGERIPLKDTRTILDSVLSNKLLSAHFRTDEHFQFQVPEAVEGVNSDILSPQSSWNEVNQFEEQAKKVREMFVKNFESFIDCVSEEIREAYKELDF